MATDDVLAEIFGLLRKHKNISFKVSFKTVRKDTNLTTISFKETGIQSHLDSSRSSSKKPEDKGTKKRKSPSRLLRDMKRQEAFLSKKAGSCEIGDPATTVSAPSITSQATATDRSAIRHFATPGRRWRTVGAGDAGDCGSWGPGDGMEETFIPQLDGKMDESEEERTDCEEEDIVDEEVQEEKLEDKEDKEERNKKDEKEDNEQEYVFCIHEVKIDTSMFRPDCRKCRKNYYKILKSTCPHDRITEECYKCCQNPINGWMLAC